MSNEKIIQDDIGAILRALGLGDHARPISPHKVIIDEIIPKIANLKKVVAIQGEALGKIDSDMHCCEDCPCSAYEEFAKEALSKCKELLDGK